MLFKYQLIILLSAILGFFVSCTSTKNFSEIPQTRLTAINIKQLNGQFKNQEETCLNYGCSLWAHLNPFSRDSTAEGTEMNINLNVDDNFLNVSLLKDTTVLKTMKIKYKLQNGFVVFKKSRLKGIPLLFYRYQKRKNRITLDNNNNIKFYERGSGEGGIFIFIFGSPVIENYKFLRVK